MCGEHCDLVLEGRSMIGSPPHVRGTHRSIQNEIVYGRITPACAGNTPAADQLGNQKPDHPRMCGEHQTTPLHPSKTDGSPPHVRGTP